MTVVPAILVDILGKAGLARGYGIASAAAGPVTMLVLPTAGDYLGYISLLLLKLPKLLSQCYSNGLDNLTNIGNNNY